MEGEANKEQYAAEKVRDEKIEMATNCLKKGMKLSEIQNLLGLCDIRSIRRYLKSMDKKVTVTDIGKTDMFKPNNTEIKGEKLC